MCIQLDVIILYNHHISRTTEGEKNCGTCKHDNTSISIYIIVQFCPPSTIIVLQTILVMTTHQNQTKISRLQEILIN